MNDTTHEFLDEQIERIALEMGFEHDADFWLNLKNVRIAMTEDEIKLIVFTDEKRHVVSWVVSFDSQNTPARIIKATLIEALAE